MIPEFAKARLGLREHLNKFLKERIKVHNHAFRDVPVMVIHEGTGSKTINADSDFENDMEMQSLHGESSVGHDALINNPSEVFRMLDELAQQLAEQQSRLMVQAVSDVTERTGRVSTRPGDPEPSEILNIFDQMMISFDNDGQPNMPAIHAAPDMIPKIKIALQKLESDPAFAGSLDKLIAKKKQEWNDRENNRKLVG